MEDVELRTYIHILREKIRYIFMMVVVGVILSGALTYFVWPPEYETFTTFMVGRVDAGEDDKDYPVKALDQNLIMTYGEIGKSQSVAKAVVRNLGLNRTAEELTKKIQITLVEDTEIIKIRVRDKDPTVAKSIADELIKVLTEHIERIMGVKNLKVIDLAEVPKAPVKPILSFNLVVGGLLGMMLSVFTLLLSEYLDDTIKREEDVRAHLGLPVLGVIPEEEENKS